MFNNSILYLENKNKKYFNYDFVPRSIYLNNKMKSSKALKTSTTKSMFLSSEIFFVSKIKIYSQFITKYKKCRNVSVIITFEKYYLILYIYLSNIFL